MSGRIRHHVVIADEAAFSVLCGLKRAERSAAEGQDFADLACMLPSLPHVRLWLSAKLAPSTSLTCAAMARYQLSCRNRLARAGS